MKIKVKAKINPSEDSEKVREAVKALFPELDLQVSDDLLMGESTNLEALENLKNNIGLQAIRSSARRELKKGIEEDTIHFFLNRQAAKVHKVSFSGQETPLGPIEVWIESDDIGEIIDYLAPG